MGLAVRERYTEGREEIMRNGVETLLLSRARVRLH